MSDLSFVQLKHSLLVSFPLQLALCLLLHIAKTFRIRPVPKWSLWFKSSNPLTGMKSWPFPHSWASWLSLHGWFKAISLLLEILLFFWELRTLSLNTVKASLAGTGKAGTGFWGQASTAFPLLEEQIWNLPWGIYAKCETDEQKEYDANNPYVLMIPHSGEPTVCYKTSSIWIWQLGNQSLAKLKMGRKF